MKKKEGNKKNWKNYDLSVHFLKLMSNTKPQIQKAQKKTKQNEYQRQK